MSQQKALKLVLETFPLGRTPFRSFDPFLFCVHHDDAYPGANPAFRNTTHAAGTDAPQHLDGVGEHISKEEHRSMGPDPKLLRGRDMGSDFSYDDGWSMYHGQTVPGFPSHPHRGFETITIVRRGFVDHCDSLGCTARYSRGDTQWLTAGRGIQHTEMFPLLAYDKTENMDGGAIEGPEAAADAAVNPLELFQIWLNLPKKSKMCEPYFSMFWREDQPVAVLPDLSGATGRTAEVQVVAGALGEVQPLAPPPDSWASNGTNNVAVWLLRLPAGVTVELPAALTAAAAAAASRGANPLSRAFYFVKGSDIFLRGGEADEKEVPIHVRTGVRVDPAVALRVRAAADGGDAIVLMLQGAAIGEPVAQHGPFVMNTREEIMQCFADYQKTEFGGWPWPTSDYCHARSRGRHALHAGARLEYPPADNKNKGGDASGHRTNKTEKS
ncbi:Pirin domain-containing protein [Strigomonas culicis]|uniref:Pirin domain-containing protein n=1 Tax=Strigomonas culicis TaxID=28005 RepID=S9UNI8_9TRYP|nr:Pirin domain-containing protein [Strigomonas culicis]|eukprot:EPY16231.1 Pirin domain-containing protein [Strigomonas culicis]